MIYNVFFECMKPFEEMLYRWQPDALFLCIVEDCPCCTHEMFFYCLPQFVRVDARGMVSGGFYCPGCGFSNAGALDRESVNSGREAYFYFSQKLIDNPRPPMFDSDNGH